MELVICQVAAQQGITEEQCRYYMAEAIREAWTTTDPEVKQRQIELIGDDHIPSPEELILIISQNIY